MYTTECQINFTLRVLQPILKGQADIVEVTAEAEKRDINEVQEKAKGLVWATGCTSWFIDEKTGRNTIMFPDWQYKFWLRSVFVSWGDFEYRNVSTKGPVDTSPNRLPLLAAAGLLGFVSCYFQIRY